MFSAKPRILLPAATLLAATFFIASAVCHGVAPVVAAHPQPAFNVVQAEILQCAERTGRSVDDCADEAEGKALIQRAEQMAQAQARHGVSRAGELADEIDSATTPRAPRSRLQ